MNSRVLHLFAGLGALVCAVAQTLAQGQSPVTRDMFGIPVEKQEFFVVRTPASKEPNPVIANRMIKHGADGKHIRSYAIVVAISKYHEMNNVAALTPAETDRKNLVSFLKRQDFDEVFVLADDKATRENIDYFLDYLTHELETYGKGARVLFAYTGHGVPKHLVLGNATAFDDTAHNYSLRSLETKLKEIADSSWEFLALINSCHGGGLLTQPVMPGGSDVLPGARGAHTVVATTAKDLSYALTKDSGSIFFDTLIRGITTGEGDERYANKWAVSPTGSGKLGGGVVRLGALTAYLQEQIDMLDDNPETNKPFPPPQFSSFSSTWTSEGSFFFLGPKLMSPEMALNQATLAVVDTVGQFIGGASLISDPLRDALKAGTVKPDAVLAAAGAKTAADATAAEKAAADANIEALNAAKTRLAADMQLNAAMRRLSQEVARTPKESTKPEGGGSRPGVDYARDPTEGGRGGRRPEVAGSRPGVDYARNPAGFGGGGGGGREGAGRRPDSSPKEIGGGNANALAAAKADAEAKSRALAAARAKADAAEKKAVVAEAAARESAKTSTLWKDQMSLMNSALAAAGVSGYGTAGGGAIPFGNAMLFNPPDSYDIMGVDMSEFDQVNWDFLKENKGIRFAYVRATSRTKRDKKFETNWKEAHKTGWRVGAYHYFKSTYSAEEQFAVIKATVPKDKPDTPKDETSLPFALDIEPWNQKESIMDKAAYTSALLKLQKLCSEHFGKPAILFSRSAFFNLFPDVMKQSHFVWLANFSPDFNATLPSGQPWTLWQFSNPDLPELKKMRAARKKLKDTQPRLTDYDLNAFNGTEEQFQQFAAGVPPPK